MKMQIHLPLLIITLLSTCVCASAQTIVFSNPNDGAPMDTDNDGIGDQTHGFSGTNNFGRLGEATKDNPQTRLVFPFDLGSVVSEVNAASLIELTLTVDANVMPASPAFNVDLYTLDSRTNTDVVASDYEAAATLLTNDFVTTSASNGDSFTVDVTSFVQGRIASETIVGFRLQLDPTDIATQLGSNDDFDRYQFYMSEESITADRPQLTIVPEPASMGIMLALLALGFTCLSRKPRSRIG